MVNELKDATRALRQLADDIDSLSIDAVLRSLVADVGGSVELIADHLEGVVEAAVENK